MKGIFSFIVPVLIAAMASAVFAEEMAIPHKVLRDRQGKILAWHKPDVPGAAFAHVSKLASEFIKTVPVEPASGLKLYMVHSVFRGPSLDENYYKGTTGSGWMPNPACVFAGFVQSLAVDYRVFSGDDSYIDIVRECL
ncbi:MAG: hypothetical protein U9P14_08235, partial [Gemmatimonadota bacterium]|nr:hypothetical protein [Gemmatimonadota bacterium]